MKVLMINDCAYVGETILKYLPKNIETHHIKRTRSFWSKTFGITYQILKARADIYHVNYLLQDCYVLLKLGKHPVIGHAHGSDLRSGLKHRIWRKIVEYNLLNCDKVLVSTPDILGIAREYRKDAEYLPNPVDIQTFYPKFSETQSQKTRVLIASDCNWAVKGTDKAVRALSRLKNVEATVIQYGVDFERTLSLAKSLGLKLRILPRISHQNIREYYWDSDVVIDRFKLGSLGMVSLEAIASGRPVITDVSSKYRSLCDFPIQDTISVKQITHAIRTASPTLWIAEKEYLDKNHNPEKVAQQVYRLYLDMIRIHA